ncbi:MAG: class I SAM-dependent methyltransferase [Candidatus Aadella gelida]|nr:class I SAM-dependent methyltransferase [Candidatus Aadella gelida]
MRYLPNLTDVDIRENHKIFKERLDVYKNEGLDFLANREYLLDKVGLAKSKVLDVGTGRGLTCLYLADAGHSVITVDIKDEMLKIAALNLAHKKLLSNVMLYKMDAYALDFENDSFGAVFIVEALHHIEDLNKMLREIDRVVISNSKLVLADFNEKGMFIVDKIHKREGNVHTNLSTGPEKPREWLMKHGYEVKLYDDVCQWVIVAIKG